MEYINNEISFISRNWMSLLRRIHGTWNGKLFGKGMDKKYQIEKSNTSMENSFDFNDI